MAAAAATYPPWVMLEHYCTLEVQGSSSIADTNTVASCRTTAGHPINVALFLAAPPEGSRVCVQLPDGIVAPYAVVVAAHGDSVVVKVGRIPSESTDDFVYSAGDAAAEPPRPPSLSLLPPHSIITYEDEETPRAGCDYLEPNSTGLLRRGDGDFMVAELKMEYVEESDGEVNIEAELHLLRSSSCEWRVKRPVISGYAGECVDDPASSWQTHIVIPVGDKMLCWVDLVHGLLFSDDVFNESPGLRYVPLPEDPDLGQWSVCVTADGTTIKAVHVFPRCCCGGAGKSSCRASHHAYAVHTWTLRMDDVDDMAWVMDGSLDATQLWALDGYNGLPRVELDYPVVSMDEPDAISFVVCERHHEKHGDSTTWRIMIDMKSKTLRSVFRHPEGRRSCMWDRHLPSRVSNYFNSKPSTGQPGPSARTEALLDLRNRRSNSKLQAINGTMQAASPSTDAAMILIALQEIPCLDRDELLKAYRILTQDRSGCRFRALMEIKPMDLRKDCVLMEIKASEACVLCSACSADLKIKE